MSDERTTQGQISDSDWLYVCTIAQRTQDGVQRNLLEILSKATSRVIPLFPKPEPRPASAKSPDPKRPA